MIKVTKSLFAKITIRLLIVVIIICSTMVGISYFLSSKEIVKSKNIELQQTVKQTTNLVSSTLYQDVKIIESIAQREDVKVMDYNKILPLLKKESDRLKYNGIIIVDKEE